MDSINMMVSMLLGPKLGLDAMQSVVLTQTISSVTKSDIFRNITTNFEHNIPEISGVYYVIFGCCIICYVCYKYFYNWFYGLVMNNSNTVTYNVYNGIDKSKILEYVKNNCINKNISLNIGTDKILATHVGLPNYSFDTPIDRKSVV